MSSIPSNFNRIPNLLMAQGSLASLTRTQLSLFQVQQQLSTGLAITRFSDDAVKAAAISVLDARLDLAEQRRRNLDHADSSLSTLDKALGDASELVLEAKGIASNQIGVGSSASERAAQAEVVSSLIQNLFGISNRESAAGHIFGGSTPGSPAVTSLLGGYRYMGQGSGLITDLGLGSSVPITIGGRNSIGSTSARVESSVDMNPGLVSGTRIVDVAGARGVGVTLGSLEFSFDNGPRVRVDLSGADRVQDVADRLTAAIREYEQANTVTVLGPGGISLSGGALSVDVAPAVSGPNPQLVFTDVGTGKTAQDLGLAAVPAMPFSAGTSTGLDLNARLTWQTPISALAGISGALGSIKVNNLGQSRVIDLSGAQTLEDVKNLIEGTGIGVRVELNEARTGINVVNETAAGRQQAMSIEEVPGSNLTATRLGIRTLGASTRLQDFNDGRGVQIAHGAVDPVTGVPSPTRDVDFAITLGDPAGTVINIDLRPEDMATVQTLIDRINSQAAAAGVNVPADFEAGLGDGANGLVLRQNSSFTSPLTVADKNASPAAEQLGLLSGVYDPTTTSFLATDRAKVRVDNLFTQLIDLRDALQNNDTIGITLAGEKLESSVSRLAETRALVGGYAKRVSDGQRQQEDQVLLDEKTRSDLRDLDYTEAAVRLNLLQTQFQAGLQVTALSQQRTLLDFLG